MESAEIPVNMTIKVLLERRGALFYVHVGGHWIGTVGMVHGDGAWYASDVFHETYESRDAAIVGLLDSIGDISLVFRERG